MAALFAEPDNISPSGSYIEIPPEIGSVNLLQTDLDKSFANFAPQKQCRKGVDLTKITSIGPNPMYDYDNYTTCFDL